MIEIVTNDMKINPAKLVGKFLIMTLQLGEFKSFYPGAVVFVEKADPAKGKMEVRPARSSVDEHGVYRTLTVVGGEDNTHMLRLEQMNVFLCDSQTDALAVLTARKTVDDMIERDAGRVEVALIGRQIEAAYQDLVDQSRRNEFAVESETPSMKVN